jgi:hypothetical protein
MGVVPFSPCIRPAAFTLRRLSDVVPGHAGLNPARQNTARRFTPAIQRWAVGERVRAKAGLADARERDLLGANPMSSPRTPSGGAGDARLSWTRGRNADAAAAWLSRTPATFCSLARHSAVVHAEAPPDVGCPAAPRAPRSVGWKRRHGQPTKSRNSRPTSVWTGRFEGEAL